MDTSKFEGQIPGELIPIKTQQGRDHAFAPDPLPPKWEFPNHLWPKLSEAKSAISKLDGIGSTLPDPSLLITPLQKREALASSRLEGTYATAEELLLFEIDPQESKSQHDQANAWTEVHNYASALKQGTHMLTELPFCSRLFKSLHRTLMQGVKGPQAGYPGEWRKHQVAIGSNYRFVPPPPAQMEQCLIDLEKYVNVEKSAYDPLVNAYLVHYQFETIHPFNDGNGRIGRVILSLMVGKWCNLTFPWLYMSAFFEKYKEEYISNLFKVSSKGDWETWIDFCLTGTIRQANDAIVRCAALNKLKKEMLEKASLASPRMSKIIDSLFSVPMVRVGRLSKDMGITYPTAKSDIEKLIALGILQPVPNAKQKTYFSPQIFAIAYNEDTAGI